MKSSHRASMKKTWVGLWAATLIIHRMYQLVYHPFDSYMFMPDIYYWLEVGMFLSSFPGSLLFVIVGEGVTSCVICVYVRDPLLFWIGVCASGYIQWFYVVPRLLRTRKIITLNLGSAGAMPPFDNSASSSRPPEKILPQNARRIEPSIPQTTGVSADEPADSNQRAFRVACDSEPPVARFDERGRSPIERAFGDVLSG